MEKSRRASPQGSAPRKNAVSVKFSLAIEKEAVAFLLYYLINYSFALFWDVCQLNIISKCFRHLDKSLIYNSKFTTIEF